MQCESLAGLPCVTADTTNGGVLIINADDWGRDLRNTDCALVCWERGALSSVSAMVFMADSERAASIAEERGIDSGLHLNFTAGFTAANCPRVLIERQARLAQYLRRHRLSQVVFNPWLRKSFQYVVQAQVGEFQRLYKREPDRFDGHHHMHLCANVLWQRLLPEGTRVRRNFSFAPGQKSPVNVSYRSFVDGVLARRHRLTDYFFSIEPLEPAERLQVIFSLADNHSVEVETHPVNGREFAFLSEGEIVRVRAITGVGRPSGVRPRSSV